MTRESDVSGKRRISDPAFFGFLTLVVVAIIGTGMYLIGPAGTTGTGPVSSAPTASRPLTPKASATVKSSATAKSKPSAAAKPAPSEAGAVALVEKYFRLALAGDHAQACALQSPAYLRSDIQRYPNGGCAAESRATADALAAKGIALRFVSAEVTSFGDGKATVRTIITVGSQEVAQNLYLRYRDGRWWLTGGADSGGDVGF